MPPDASWEPSPFDPYESDDGQGWQIGIGVEANVRGQGIGQRLVEHAIDYSRAIHSPFLVLLVDPANTPAIALYRRTGFFEVGERENVIEMRFDLGQNQP